MHLLTTQTPNPAKPDDPTGRGGVLSPQISKTASPLQRCDTEIACALEAIRTGSCPLEDALLYWFDWTSERKLVLTDQDGHLEEAQREIQHALGMAIATPGTTTTDPGEPK